MKVLLVCSGGMSSAIVVKAIEKEAEKRGLNMTVKSIGTGELNDEVKNGWNVLLVAPQVRHRVDAFREAVADYHVPVALIPPQGYSPMGGAVVMEEILRIIK
jgi:PTS system cellobiose-specific IIB component